MTPLHGALYRFFGIDKRHNVAKRNVQLFDQVGLASLASHVRNTEFHSGAEMAPHAWMPEKLGAAVGRALVFDSDELVVGFDDPRLTGDGGEQLRWRLQLTGARLAQGVLHDEFGYDRRTMLVCHSGGRGVHIHVPAASDLSGEARKAVADVFHPKGRSLQHFADALAKSRLVSCNSATWRDATAMMAELVAAPSPGGLDLFADVSERVEQEGFVRGKRVERKTCSGEQWFANLKSKVERRGDAGANARFLAFVLANVGMLIDRNVTCSFTHTLRMPFSPGKSGHFRCTPLPAACLEHPATLPSWAPLRINDTIGDDHESIVAVRASTVGLQRGVHVPAAAAAAATLCRRGRSPPVSTELAAELDRFQSEQAVATTSKKLRDTHNHRVVDWGIANLLTEAERAIFLEMHCYDMAPSVRWPMYIKQLFMKRANLQPSDRPALVKSLICNGCPPVLFARFFMASGVYVGAGGRDDFAGKLRRLVPKLIEYWCCRKQCKVGFSASAALIAECERAADALCV